jgi:hypothetical protein
MNSPFLNCAAALARALRVARDALDGLALPLSGGHFFAADGIKVRRGKRVDLPGSRNQFVSSCILAGD